MSELENTGDTVAQQNGTETRLHSFTWAIRNGGYIWKTVDSIAVSPATGKSVVRIINLIVESLWNRWTRNETTCFDQTSKRFPSWFRRLEQCYLWKTANTLETRFTNTGRRRLEQCYLCKTENALETRFTNTGRTLRSENATPLMSWKKSQWNETRRKTSIALLRCTVHKSILGQINWLQRGHSSNAVTNFPDVHGWQLVQHLAMLSLSTSWRDRSSHSQ